MKRQIEFASDPANLATVRQFVRQFVNTCSFTEREVELLVLGVDEACTNIIRHVYQHNSAHKIRLNCEQFEGGIRFRLRDFGEPLANTLHPRQPNHEAPRAGGLGLHLIRCAFDQVDYQPRKIGTELVLTKHFGD